MTVVAKKHDTSNIPGEAPGQRGPFTRVELRLPSLVTLASDRAGVWMIRPEGNLSSEAVVAIQRALRDRSIVANLQVAGLLIDLRHNSRLSIVRLSDLLDGLSVFNVRNAVLFATERRCQLAQVLYGTLVNKRKVGYFTSISEAYAYLTREDPAAS